ncbi:MULTISPECIES: zinc ribbon domain-containing protein [unclassified Schaalia]|uniref:zinc ribbon domain-containing protein n=1 Tax=unclassified Schaalia TaxID=2691889 RepID=UPI001E31B4B7|nr:MULTISPECIES: hypothetical protein [unclassified Schaalia]MCD4549343.1 hypothetical protein [Schaalia sp. lx-260]MCD4557151.1 hypothetical protein [Schaalia sp. lx-100]
MIVAHADQLVLLDLQALDQKESALRHARNAHPAHATVREFAGRVEDLQRALIGQNAVIADITREVERCENEIRKVRERRDRQEERIEQGHVPLRDINPMQHEIAQMVQRLSDLENQQLNAEERLEETRNTIEQIKERIAAITADIEDVKARFLEDVATSDTELRAVIARRREVAEKLGETVLAEYERARTRHGAFAVIEVRDGVVQGAGADISPAELDTIRRTPADHMYWTEDTGQIVIRTQE